MKLELRRLIVAAALGAATATLIAPLAVQSADEAPAQVEIDNFTFSPQKLTVRTGTTITWINQDDIPHAIAAVSKAFKSNALDTGDAYTFTFTTPGKYDYFCSLHPHMTGTIVVETAPRNGATH